MIAVAGEEDVGVGEPGALEQRGEALVEAREQVDRAGAERVGVEDDQEARSLPVLGDDDVAGRKRRCGARTEHGGDAGLVGDERLEAVERSPAVVEVLAGDHGDGRREDAVDWERGSGGAVRPVWCGVVGQGADERVGDVEAQQPARGHEQQRDARDGRQGGSADGEVERPALQAAATGRLVVLQLSVVLLGRSGGPEDARTDDRQRGRDERHDDDQAHEHGEREPRAEHLEELEVGGEQRARRRDDRQAGDEHDRHDVAAAARDRLAPVLVPEAVPVAREEEDGVVGDDPEEQHDDDRLHLGGHREPELDADPPDDVDRQQVRHRDGDEVEQRRADRAEVQSDGEQDEDDGADLDERQVLGHHLPPRQRGGDRAGDGDVDLAAERPFEVLRVVLGGGELSVAVRRGTEEQVGQRRRRRRCGEELAGQRRRGDEPGLVDLPAGDPLGRPRELLERAPVERLAGVGDDDGAAEQREREQRLGQPLGLERLGLLGDDAPDRAGAGLLDRRKLGHRGDRRRDPEDHDREAQPDDEAGESVHERDAGDRRGWFDTRGAARSGPDVRSLTSADWSAGAVSGAARDAR